MKYLFLVFTMLTSLAFGQFEVGTTLMGGSLSVLATADSEGCDDEYDGELDCIKGDTAVTMDLTYGKFLKENLLVKGNLEYANEATNIMIGVDYFVRDNIYVGGGYDIPEEGDGSLTIGAGMLNPFKESSNVYLNPNVSYGLDSELFSLGVGLILLF
ncbi:MAG: hypothetical protein P8L43_04670 [Candidatus Marinimicrobia bacterium]|nr:hypothetical protein [Candidatus Neomarinimicrobiota bacterium]